MKQLDEVQLATLVDFLIYDELSILERLSAAAAIDFGIHLLSPFVMS